MVRNMGGLLIQKLKLKSQTTGVLHKKKLKKKTHQPFGEGGEGLKWK
jgi:hypothetical protein